MKNTQQIYEIKKEQIQSRLNDFKRFYNEPVSWFYENNEIVLKPVSKSFNQRIFEELCFCILTANTSAVMGLKGVDFIRLILESGTIELIKDKLVESGYRFPNIRAKYIFEARDKNFNFEEIFQKNKFELREFFVNNVKGLGYKESSHFLRNIGIFGLAILDKHIIKTMYEFNIINEIPKSLNKNKYLDLEQKYVEFSNQLNINMDELDLLLWSIKNGRILK